MIDNRMFDDLNNFVKYIEAFSFANRLAGEVEQESLGMHYSGKFGSQRLLIEVVFSKNGVEAKIKYSSSYGHKISSHNQEDQQRQRRKYDMIKSSTALKTSSYEPLKNTMNFVTVDLIDLNLLINTLVESD